MQLDETYISEAIAIANKNIDKNGGPFGAIIVFKNTIIARGSNTVTLDNDPTAHAEINAIRKASDLLKSIDLSGCVLYSSCEPCPMCLSAIYWAKIDKVYYSTTREDAQNAGFDDNFLYNEFTKPLDQRKIPFINIVNNNAIQVFEKWISKSDKIPY